MITIHTLVNQPALAAIGYELVAIDGYDRVKQAQILRSSLMRSPSWHGGQK
ncbi:MAG: hypothetical protein GKR95_13135 [Gammaproteobacteria bacterium]|nr:hypothetical protein [Gammaproteobacteria bacterium]NKB63013.1 hypothetical protein [Gammaproteobacteria bacterium]